MALKFLLITILMFGVTVSKYVFARPESSSYLVLPENIENSQLKEYADNYYDDAVNAGNVEYQMKQALNRYPLQKIVYPQKWYSAPQNLIVDQGISKLYKEKPVLKPQPEIENVVTDKRTSNSYMSMCHFKICNMGRRKKF